MSASGLIGSSMECQRAHEFEDNWLHPALDETLELFATSSRSYLPSFARFMNMDDFWEFGTRKSTGPKTHKTA